MPFLSIEELPEEIKKQMPEGAQRLYLGAYNSAWNDYEDLKHEHADETREEIAENLAWSAVSGRYYKGSDGYWHRR